MISIKAHIAEYDRQLADALLFAWRATLIAAWKAGGQAVPARAQDLRESLNPLNEQLTIHTSPSEIDRIRGHIEAELARWGDATVEDSLKNLKQVRAMVIVMAESAAAIAERDQRNRGRLQGITERFQAVSRIPNVNAMRAAVTESAAEMNACLEEMTREGDLALLRMKTEVARYRAELKDYQKRDATDHLTGLASRQAIDAQIEDRIAWSAKFCLGLIDLDRFKEINDTYGHAAGDDLLTRFAAEMRSRVGSRDVVGRWGGDEFIIIIDSTLQEAHILLDHLRQWVFGDYTIMSGSDMFSARVSAAVGLAEWDGKESAGDLFNRVDNLMCKDKRTSRVIA